MVESKFGATFEIEQTEAGLDKISEAEKKLRSEATGWASSEQVKDLRPGGKYSKKVTALATMFFLFGLTTGMAAAGERRPRDGETKVAASLAETSESERGANDTEKKLSPETKQALKDILAYDVNDVGLILSLIPPEADYFRGAEKIAFNKEHVFSAEAPIQLKQDQLNYLQFCLAYPENEWSARGLSRPLNETTQDKYGNYLRRNGDFVTGENGQKMYGEVIRIYPKFFGAPSKNGQTEMWSFDLSSFGHQEIKNLVERQAVPSRGEVGPYQLYTQSPELDFSPEQMIRLESLGQGQAAAEEFFGFAPGEIVKNILVVNETGSRGPVASTREKNIVYYPESFLREEGYGDETYGAHEAIHNVIASLSLIGPAMAKEYEVASLRSDLTNQVNEGNSYRGLIQERAGHAGDNEDEFITSVINSLRSPDWKAWVARQGSEWRQWYKEVLRSLQSDCRRQEKINESAPIMKSLTEKISFLEAKDSP